MKRDISGTSVATAVLLTAAAVLLCSQLQGLDAHAISLPIAAALSIEVAFYAGTLYVWCGRFRPLAFILGIPVLIAIRIVISTGAALCAQLDAGHRTRLGAPVFSPMWTSWMTAVAFAIIVLYLVRGALWRAPVKDQARSNQGVAAHKRRGKDSAMAEPRQAKVALDTATPTMVTVIEGSPAAARPAGDDGDVFQVFEPTARRVQSGSPVVQPTPQIEGWVTIPASVVAEQLPAGAQVKAAELLIPLALVMPRLREGEVRIPVTELEDVSIPMGASDQALTIVLPLQLIAPQIPDEALELPETPPPSWLIVDAALEDVFFAKV